MYRRNSREVFMPEQQPPQDSPTNTEQREATAENNAEILRDLSSRSEQAATSVRETLSHPASGLLSFIGLRANQF
jgi:hypothetical protein